MPDDPDPERGSTAPYIIICNGRIGVEASRDQSFKIQRASEAAMHLVSYYAISSHDSGIPITPADTKPISDIQHWLMDNMRSRKKKEVDAKIAELFELLDALEDKFGG